MKRVHPGVVFFICICLVIALYYVTRKRREGYTQEAVNPSEIAGNVEMTTYDNKQSRKYEAVVDDKYIILKGKTENGTEYYLSIKNGAEVENTNTTSPQGEYRFRIVRALNGDSGYYSMAIGDSERYFMIDVTNEDAGVIDLKGVDDISKKVKEPKAFNFLFKKM